MVTTAKTQGPPATVSSVVIEEERMILKCLHDINDLLDYHLATEVLVLKVFLVLNVKIHMSEFSDYTE